MVCSLIESLFSMPGAMEKIGEKLKVRNFICQTFIFSYIWGLGGNINEDSREKFDVYVQSQFDDCADARLPPGQDLWYNFMDTQTHRLTSWQKLMPEYSYDKKVPFFDILVPTLDTVRFGYIMERLLYVGHPVLVTGDTGVGKTAVAKNVFNGLEKSGLFVAVTMNFSAQTSSVRTQEIIELKLERKKKTLFGAPVGKKVIIFIDDVNMPKLEIYGAQPPIELIRKRCYCTWHLVAL
ncbi:dynein heavy chain 6, axonemal-like [Sitophilus oryzae]|uniref:Dynein heavy chain 6, axonemal-like n=1 Tax=Sitophilus oryzae TaxID=7048 RepID=A0A6J2XT62_SITOR|nr:dynein heavy chain 6, axonemal-like [Sitophilus oryzae]